MSKWVHLKKKTSRAPPYRELFRKSSSLSIRTNRTLAEISIPKAEDLYREIRIDNVLKDEKGEEAALKEGAPVDVTIEADKKDTTKKAS